MERDVRDDGPGGVRGRRARRGPARSAWVAGVLGCCVALAAACGSTRSDMELPGGGGEGAGAGAETSGPWRTAYIGDASAATRGLPSSCAEIVARELTAGEISDRRCDRARFEATSRATPPEDAVFGVGRVWGRTLDGFWIRVVRAQACERWPLRQAGGTVLSEGDAEDAGCDLRPVDAPLTVEAELRDGSLLRVDQALPIREGMQRVRIDALVGAVVGADPSVDVTEIEALRLGQQGWLGRIELSAWLDKLAERETVWIELGWSTPETLEALVPGHEGIARSRLLTLERLMLRQQADFQQVCRGTLSAQTFLARHPWSPYRSGVRRHLGLPSVVGSVNIQSDAAATR